MTVIARHFITLTQPWATLMALGWKTVETRSWSTRFRGPLAIHAAKGFPLGCRDLIEEPFFSTTLRAAGYSTAKQLPLGQILAVCFLEGCEPTEQLAPKISEMEQAFGDYSAGRFGFVTSEVRKLKTPMQFKGALGIRPLPEPITEDMLA